jgi:hypothetical protein
LELFCFSLKFSSKTIDRQHGFKVQTSTDSSYPNLAEAVTSDIMSGRSTVIAIELRNRGVRSGRVREKWESGGEMGEWERGKGFDEVTRVLYPC